MICLEWIQYVVHHPVREVIQADAFFDRSFAP